VTNSRQANVEAIRVDQFLPHPPATVWRALTEPELLARWWAAGDIRAVEGHEFTLDMESWGQVGCRVLEVEPERRLVYTFTDNWTLTWTLVPEGTGTRLFLEHAGFDLEHPLDRHAFDNMGPGWRDEVLPRSGLFPNSTAAAAPSELQSGVSDIIKNNGGELLSIQILPAKQEGRLQTVAVRVQFTADTDALSSVFYHLEANRPYLFIDNLQIRTGRVERRSRLARLRGAPRDAGGQAGGQDEHQGGCRARSHCPL
jgi:uncharacterized protein YndB with AHSA1/START domain